MSSTQKMQPKLSHHELLFLAAMSRMDLLQEKLLFKEPDRSYTKVRDGVLSHSVLYKTAVTKIISSFVERKILYYKEYRVNHKKYMGLFFDEDIFYDLIQNDPLYELFSSLFVMFPKK